MKSKLTLLFIFSAFYALSSSAAYVDWDDETAYRLAVASDCTYKIQNNKQSVKECFDGHIKKSEEKGSKVLAVFKDLPDDSIEVFTASSGLADNKLINTAFETAETLRGKEKREDADQINAVILVKIDRGVVIAFRGTEGTPEDWLSNANLASFNKFIFSLFKRELNEIYREGRHEGFDKSLVSLTNEIKKKSNIWKSLVENSSVKTLYLTGHSKGGALATGATVDYENDFKGSIVTYTFEAARFFTAAGVNDPNKLNKLNKIWRFEYQYDIVPHVPLGKVTYDFLKELEDKKSDLKKNNNDIYEMLQLQIAYEAIDFLMKLIGLSYDEIERNNINFVPAGRLAYVDSGNNFICFPKAEDQPDKTNREYYQDRFLESVKENLAGTLRDAKIRMRDKEHSQFYFLIDQHSKGYLRYLESEIPKQSCN